MFDRSIVATCTICFLLLISDSVYGIFMRPDLKKVPVSTLVESLEKKIKEKPDDSTLRLNLARAYAMAYVKKTNELQINTRNPNRPWFGFTPIHVPFGKVEKTDDMAKQEQAKEHLELAIKHYRAAVEKDKENLTARLGLAWLQDQSGNDMEAIEGYRDVIKLGWEKEKDMQAAGLAWHSVVAEASNYLKKHLDNKEDADEIADLDAKIKTVSKIMRPITPIAIPLSNGLNLKNIVDQDVVVHFDADGSGHKKKWNWIKPSSGWLVYDQTGSGEIDSAIQMFGSVTFMCFWQNGYEAMSTLDRNDNGWLENEELIHLAIWNDVNSNGISEREEVRPLCDYQIEAINCQGIDLEGTSIKHSPRGVRFCDKTYRPTYDVILQQKK